MVNISPLPRLNIISSKINFIVEKTKKSILIDTNHFLWIFDKRNLIDKKLI